MKQHSNTVYLLLLYFIPSLVISSINFMLKSVPYIYTYINVYMWFGNTPLTFLPC